MAGLAKSFGVRVRDLRSGLRMTQSQLAEVIDMSVEWVRRIENGGASPSFDTISALAKALHARPADLFADEELRAENHVASALNGLTEREIEWLLDGISLLRSRPLVGADGPKKPSGSKARLKGVRARSRS